MIFFCRHHTFDAGINEEKIKKENIFPQRRRGAKYKKKIFSHGLYGLRMSYSPMRKHKGVED